MQKPWMFGTTSGTRSTFFSFRCKVELQWNWDKTVTSTGPFLQWNLQFQWKLHLCLGRESRTGIWVDKVVGADDVTTSGQCDQRDNPNIQHGARHSRLTRHTKGTPSHSGPTRKTNKNTVASLSLSGVFWSIFSCAATLYFNPFFFWFFCLFVKIQTEPNKTKLTELNLIKPNQLSKTHQTWFNQTKPDQAKPDQTKPNFTKNKICY